MKRALILNAVEPQVGGVLIRGERGTAKSTAVRALAGLLPELAVVSGCRFSCDPDAPARLCAECVQRQKRGEVLGQQQVPMQVIELPLNASEDRVVGSLDVEAGIVHGETRFEPGLLARANRNLLYVDEVNLLDDHIVDMILDAAAMGQNIVEREGLSISHPASFILVGTMNPSEGDLRPQLTDRFGISVDVGGNRDLERRVEIIERNTGGALPSNEEDERLAELIVKARELVGLVTIGKLERELIATLCVDAGVVGHRADIVIAHTAKAICALREAEAAGGVTGMLEVSVADVLGASELALAHRRRNTAKSQKMQPDTAKSPAQPQPVATPPQTQESEQPVAASEAQSQPSGGEESPDGDSDSGSDAGATRSGSSDAGGTGVRFAGDLFSVRKISLPRDRRSRRAAGKRTPSVSKDRRGRYVRSEPREHVTDVALDATLRAAAPHQARRRAQADSEGLVVERQDLRQKVRRRKTGTLIVFVVDASASMDAEQRMLATKGAVLSLLRDAYLRRDKVSLIVFSGRTAKVVLAPTSSTDLAQSRLQRLGVGGTTPLTHGLMAGLRVIRSERLRDSSVRPLLVLISDGRGNISLFGEEPIVEAQKVADQLGAEGIRTLIIDSSRDYAGGSSMLRGYGANACRDLADRSGGEYLGLFDLSQGAILAGVERSLRSR